MVEYADFLKSEGLSENTRKKYLRDANALLKFADGRDLTPELLGEYKQNLLENHPENSAKSMIIAVNKYLEFAGVLYRIPHKDVNYSAVKSPERKLSVDEYEKILSAAGVFADDRMYMLIKTLCGAGLQVSELKYVTVRAVCDGEISLPCGKRLRTIFLPKKLCEELKNYCSKKRIESGQVFVTRSGKPLDRGNILRNLKKICGDAKVDPTKVSSQELKNLHVRTYDSMRREIVDRMGL